MDWKPFDRGRETVGPDELDLIESYAKGRINRRDFVRRGTVIGLSVPFLGAIIAACGGDDDAETTDTAADGGSDTTPGSAPASTGGTPGGVIRVAVAKPAGPLDPVNMQDLGTYGVVAQCFEFLTTLGDSEISPGVGPGLAESWEPNEDGSVWTFNLRQGVKWHDGTDFTSADVAATMDRLSAAKNAGLQGVIEAGSVDASDPTKAVFTLLAPNGSLPYLVSVYNAQSLITPVAFVDGSTLDGSPNGTGAFKLKPGSFDAATGVEFERNPDWWGGETPLDGSVWSFYDDEGSMVSAASAGEVDALVQFQAISGAALFNDPNFNVLTFQATTHSQIWMRCDIGQFADSRVRRALGMCLDRQALIDTLFQGKADIGNDHVIAPVYPFFDPSVPQRVRDTEGAKALLAEAGFPDGLSAVLHFGDLNELPELAQLVQAQAVDGGFTLEIAGESTDTFYGTQWCPDEPADPPCSGAAELGIINYGHRATPDVYLNAALSTGGAWNSSQYSSPEFDALFAEYSAAITLEARKAACTKIEELLLEDSPILVPYFYNYISGFSNKFTGVRVSALGQMFLDQAATA